MSHVSVLLPSLERLVWPWLAADYMLHLPLDHPITITLARLVATLGTSCMSATCVVSPSTLKFLADSSFSFRTRLAGKI